MVQHHVGSSHIQGTTGEENHVGSSQFQGTTAVRRNWICNETLEFIVWFLIQDNHCLLTSWLTTHCSLRHTPFHPHQVRGQESANSFEVLTEFEVLLWSSEFWISMSLSAASKQVTSGPWLCHMALLVQSYSTFRGLLLLLHRWLRWEDTTSRSSRSSNKGLLQLQLQPSKHKGFQNWSTWCW